jgi:DNA-directed RNA polymerase subunit N (RpoN/RPB10)
MLENDRTEQFGIAGLEQGCCRRLIVVAVFMYYLFFKGVGNSLLNTLA